MTMVGVERNIDENSTSLELALTAASKPDPKEKFVLGPHRIYPGKLSVSRSFGDVHIKHPKYGGIFNLLIAEPEIREIAISNDADFILMGCDGIFDHMTNEEAVNSVWMNIKNDKDSSNQTSQNIHKVAGLCIDMILKSSMCKKSFDNVTAVIIAFKGFESQFSKLPEYSYPRIKKVSFDLSKTPKKFEKPHPSSVPETPSEATSAKKENKVPNSGLTFKKFPHTSQKSFTSGTSPGFLQQSKDNLLPVSCDLTKKIQKAATSSCYGAAQPKKTTTKLLKMDIGLIKAAKYNFNNSLK